MLEESTLLSLLSLRKCKVAVGDCESGELLDWNEAFEELVLSNRGEELKNKKTLMNVFHVEEGCWKGKILDVEVRLNQDLASPVPRWVSLSIQTVQVKRKLCATFKDVLLVEVDDLDDKKRAETQFTGCLETSFDGFWDWYIEKDYEYMSPQFWRMFGIDPREKLNKPSEWMGIIFEEDLKVALENFKKHCDTRGKHPYFQEVRYRHVDGSTVWVRCKGQVTEWDAEGKALRMVGTHTDITELKKQAEEERRLRGVIEKQHIDLQNRAEELHRLVHRANAPVIGVDLSGCITHWNDSVASLTNFPEDEVQGQPLANLCSAESCEYIQTLLDSNLEKRQENNITLRLKKKLEPIEMTDKEEEDDYVCILANSTVRLDRGHPVGGYLLGQDITQVKLATEKVIEEATKAKAEQALNEYVAHEVRNPVFAAQSAADFLYDELKRLQKSNQEGQTNPIEKNSVLLSQSDFHTIQKDVSIIQSNLGFICDLLTSLLDLNKFLAGGLGITPSRLDIDKDVIEPIIAMLKRRCSDDVEIVVETNSDGNSIILGDETRLKQIVGNLLSNSLKFTLKGWVKISSTFTDDTFSIVIEDTGPGVPLKERTSLFKRFSQTAGHKQGSGIGLYLSKLVVERLGGTINFDSTYQSTLQGCPGARFIITLPRTLESSPMDTSSSPSPALPRKEGRKRLSSLDEEQFAAAISRLQLRVLIVDDDPSIRAVLSRRMQKLLPGADISTASSGEECLSLAENGNFDIYMIDEYMPMSGGTLLGTDTIKTLRENGNDSILIGVSGNNLGEKYRECGADLAWQKPIPGNAAVLQDLQDLLRRKGGYNISEKCASSSGLSPPHKRPNLA